MLFINVILPRKFLFKLNAAGLVDAVISEDSDSFCYGAETVLRNFSIAPSGNFVEKFTSPRYFRFLLYLYKKLFEACSWYSGSIVSLLDFNKPNHGALEEVS